MDEVTHVEPRSSDAPRVEPAAMEPPVEPGTSDTPPGAPVAMAPHARAATHRAAGSRAVVIGIAAAVGFVLLLGTALFARATSERTKEPLAAAPKPVTVAEVVAEPFHPTRRYVAALEPWSRASVGPQLVSAYVDTVLVRPGAEVKRGEIVATLDCKSASAQSQGIAMQARALEARQAALAKESARVTGLLDGGFVSANEVDQRQAEVASMEAQLLATKAKLVGTSLEVNDCVLRAPFDGEIAERFMDPGAFVRPGQAVVSVVDRSTVRISADVAEGDFAYVAPGTTVRAKLLATGAELEARVARRAPAADAATRTIHFELDLPDTERKLPVGTTAELIVEVGEPQAATKVPLAAASMRSGKARVYVVKDGTAKLTIAKVEGEANGFVYVDGLAPGSQIVTEGWALLADGDKVAAKLEAAKPAPSAAATTAFAPAPPASASVAPVSVKRAAP